MQLQPCFRRYGGLGLLSFIILSFHNAHAGSATWNAVPGNSSWPVATNWTPATVPLASTDVATFEASSITNITSGLFGVASIVFNPGASAYTLNPSNPYVFTMGGAGIMNNSGILQTILLPAVPQFVGDEESDNLLIFANSATAGSLTQYTLFGSTGADGKTDDGGEINFKNTSSAGAASFILNSGGRSGQNTGDGGIISFTDSSTAGNATFTLDGGSVSQGRSAFIIFQSNSTAGSATFTCNGGLVAGGVGSGVSFTGTSSADNATITNNGGAVAGASASATTFFGSVSAGNATLIARGGVDTGGKIVFNGTVNGGTARIEVFGNGLLDVSAAVGGLSTGSLEGDGTAVFGAQNLSVGTNGLSTQFAGVLRDDGGIGGGSGGSLTKVGTGTLTLAGANTYTGGTTASQGTLLVTNQTGSGTGTGDIQVNTGTLGGGGIIAGTVTVGTGSGAGSFLAPAAGTTTQARLTIQSAVILNSDATYTYTFKANTKHARTDLVIANGVTINSATLAINATTQGRMKRGLVLNVLSNTSANSISGTFSNLPDGAIVNVNGNNLQASYSGGDGNDLTLTVVP